MRKIGFFLALLAFLIFLFLGFQVATLFISPGGEQSGNLTSTEESFQSNCLILHVDQLNGERPALTSIWVAFSYKADPASLSFLPLYPTGRTGEEQMAARFSLSSGDRISNAFLEQLQREYSLQWDHIVLIDQDGAAYWMRFLTGGEFNQPPDATGETLIKSESDLLAAFCEAVRGRGSAVLTGLDWSQISPDHLRTDIPFDRVMGDWDRIQKSGLCDVFGR